MKAIKLLMIGATVALSGCVQTSPQPTGPHPSVWPCATVHDELQRQEQANRRASRTRESIMWVPVIGMAGMAVQPDRTRESHLSSRAYECKLKGRTG